MQRKSSETVLIRETVTTTLKTLETNLPHRLGQILINYGGIYKLRYADGQVKIFNDAGRLQEIQDKNGNRFRYMM